MEFWGLEIKPEETVKVDPGQNKYLHISQASLGETKKDKGNENVLIYVKFNNQKLVLGTLSAERCAQIQYDLVFEKEFELSHSSKNASVYLCGYKTVVVEEDEPTFPEFDESDSDADEDIQLDQKKVNGKSDVQDEQAKSTAGKPNVLKAGISAAKAKPKLEEPKKADKLNINKDDDENDDDGDEESEDESDDDEDMVEAEDGSDDEDEDESSDEEDEATVKKAEPSKKRPAGSTLKTPAPEKKSKLTSPVDRQKKGGAGKKDGHSATPHPAKQGGKTPAKNDKSKQQSPKSAGSISCKSCGKTFNSDNALQAHTKAKHSAAK